MLNQKILNFLLTILIRYEIYGEYFEQISKLEIEIDCTRVNLMVLYFMKQNKTYEAYKYFMGIDKS